MTGHPSFDKPAWAEMYCPAHKCWMLYAACRKRQKMAVGKNVKKYRFGVSKTLLIEPEACIGCEAGKAAMEMEIKKPQAALNEKRVCTLCHKEKPLNDEHFGHNKRTGALKKTCIVCEDRFFKKDKGGAGSNKRASRKKCSKIPPPETGIDLSKFTRAIVKTLNYVQTLIINGIKKSRNKRLKNTGGDFPNIDLLI